MVGTPDRINQNTVVEYEPIVAHDDLDWTSIAMSQIARAGRRLDASVYDVKVKHARELVFNSKYPTTSLFGDNGLFQDAYLCPRFKRIWVEKSEHPIYQPSSILDVYPRPDSYISRLTKTDIDGLRVKKGQILITRSGTIGNIAIVNSTLDGKIFSDDLIRARCKDPNDTGYVYAFLKTDFGRTLLESDRYGSVITHLEPEHLVNVPILNPPPIIKKRIHDMIMESYELRDMSNNLIDEATGLFFREMRLPPLDEFYVPGEVESWTVPLSKLQSRLDGSFHLPIVEKIEKHFQRHAREVRRLDDSAVSSKIILPGRFKRVYVEKGQGVVFFGGKQLFELDPSGKKYLSTYHHGKRLREQLLLKQNMILISCSGTIGKVTLVPKHWEGYAANQHVIRIIPKDKSIAGYIYIVLNSCYGETLVKRWTYGSVVDEVTDVQIAGTAIPMLSNVTIQETINELSLKANDLRFQAYKLETEAIQEVEERVIWANA